MIFKDPWVFVLIPGVFLLFYWANAHKPRPAFRFPSAELFRNVPTGWKAKLSPYLWVLRFMVLWLIVIALAGPRRILEEAKHTSEGIDIVLALDVSGSMAAEDFVLGGRRMNRLEVVKKVVGEFMEGRESDRIGLVVFGARAYTVSPLTTDYRWLKENLERIELGMVEDGTAIGSGIASALGRLKDSQAKSKVIILLTDGMNNAGKLAPLAAAKTAAAMGVKIDTIGAGSLGAVPFPVKDLFGQTFYQRVRLDLDEKTLQEIASTTGGFYFRATDTESLRRIYHDIDTMEKTKVEETGYKEYQELFPNFLRAALFILAFEIILTNTFFLRIP